MRACTHGLLMHALPSMHTGPLDSSALTAATTATAVGAPARARIDFKPRKYRPVDVFSWPEAGRVFTGFFLVVVFAAITAGLLAVYEVGAGAVALGGM